MIPVPRRRPCRFCRLWFRPDHRPGAREYACSAPACPARRKAENQRAWRDRNPGYDRRRVQKDPDHRRVHREWKRGWRAAHPDARVRDNLARRERRRVAVDRRAVQRDATALELLPALGDTDQVPRAVHQNSIITERLVLLGLASQVSPAVHQNPIAGALAAWHDRGRRLLGGKAPHAKACPG